MVFMFLLPVPVPCPLLTCSCPHWGEMVKGGTCMLPPLFPAKPDSPYSWSGAGVVLRIPLCLHQLGTVVVVGNRFLLPLPALGPCGEKMESREQMEEEETYLLPLLFPPEPGIMHSDRSGAGLPLGLPSLGSDQDSSSRKGV